MNITDSHFHIWDRTRLTYDWLSDEPPIDRDFLPADYQEVAKPSNITRSVFVEAYVNRDLCLEETEWVLRIMETHPWVAGVVGAIYLENDDADEHLEIMAERDGYVGVRRLFDPEEVDFPARPDMIAGVKKLAKYDLPFDICITSAHLPAVLELVMQAPEVRFVLDHIAKPKICDDQWEPWADQLAQLAKFDNVVCKMSGVVTEAGDGKVTVEHLKPYIDHVVSCFGFDRLMFGSDWPVCTLQAQPDQWLSILNEALGPISDDEREALFNRTCERHYRL